MADEQKLGFSALLEEAKHKGYLLHEDLLNLLPSDYVDPQQMEGIIDRLNEMGIKVFEFPPDADQLLLSETSAEEEISEAIDVLVTETRTTDPVRLYMREMGRVELLTREDEINIAKRIEEGTRQVLSAIAVYPKIVSSVIEEYQRIVDEHGRLSDIVTGFYHPGLEEGEEVEVVPEASSEDIIDELKISGEASSEDFRESGPDPSETARYICGITKFTPVICKCH